MEELDIEKVISLWQKEYTTLGSDPKINHVQIFENKGAIMGCSNPQRDITAEQAAQRLRDCATTHYSNN